MGALAMLVTATTLLPGFVPHDGVLRGVFPGEARPGYVYLPPGFTTTARYPVVYLLHGMPGDPTEYLAGTDLAGWADAAIASGSVPPFIAVLPAAGRDAHYNGEWAGTQSAALVQRIVPWIDTHLPTIATPKGRVIAGLSAGGYGAVDIALRHPGLFGTVESWSGYFRPLRDGPFKHASQKVLAANDPTKIAAAARGTGMRFFLSSGPAHSHWFKPAETLGFAHELEALGVPVNYRTYTSARGEWRAQLDAGLTWAFRATCGDFTSTPSCATNGARHTLRLPPGAERK
jgi:enterochelin esterase-like enzyme